MGLKVNRSALGAPTKKRRNRPPVLVEMTPRELVELVGADTKITVGRTRLSEILSAQKLSELIDRTG